MEVFARRPRKPFFGLALSAVAGIALADWIVLPVLALAVAVLAMGAWLLWRPAHPGCWIFTALAFALLHTERHVEDSARLFGASLREPRVMEIEGVVWSEPVVFASGRGEQAATFWLKIERCEPAAPVAGRLCMVRWRGEAPAYGARARVRGSAHALEPPRNPGQFDVGQWLARQGVCFELKPGEARDCVVTGQHGGNFLRRFGIAGRQWIKDHLDRGLPADPEVSVLINSMVLGLRGDTPPELKELFQKTGTLHLFAVSGLNVAMLMVIAWRALKPFGVRRKPGALLVIPFLAAYAVIVGLSASCTRATLVAVLILAAPLWEQDAIPLNSLSAAAFGILAVETNELFNPGFQLSFVLVLVILAFSKRLQKPLERWTEPDDFLPRPLWSRWQKGVAAAGRELAGLVAIGAACWLGSLLFMWGYFHLLSPIALAANLVAVPIAFLILGLGLLSLVLGGLTLTSASVAVNHANWLCARALMTSVDLFASVPRGHVYAEWPSVAAAPACEIVALDAGEGAAIHLRTPAGDWLIDAGHEREYGRLLLPYLRSRGVNQLDGLLLTHGDTAHAGGALLLLDDFAPRWIGDGPFTDRSRTRRAFHAELPARQRGRRFFVRGDEIALGEGALLRVLYPPRDLPPQSRADDTALVLRLETRGRRILFASDIGFRAESWLLASEPDLRSDVLVKGWAGSDVSGTPDFIRAIAPRAVICAQQGFGASEETFEEWARPLRDRGILVLSQTQCGAVNIRVEQNGDVAVTSWRR